MADENYARDQTALLFVDPYNDFLSAPVHGLWLTLRTAQSLGDC